MQFIFLINTSPHPVTLSLFRNKHETPAHARTRLSKNSLHPAPILFWHLHWIKKVL